MWLPNQFQTTSKYQYLWKLLARYTYPLEFGIEPDDFDGACKSIPIRFRINFEVACHIYISFRNLVHRKISRVRLPGRYCLFFSHKIRQYFLKIPFTASHKKKKSRLHIIECYIKIYTSRYFQKTIQGCLQKSLMISRSGITERVWLGAKSGF